MVAVLSDAQDKPEALDAEPIFPIGQVAKKYNVSLRTLRFYESSDLLHPCHRGTTRLYRAKDCRRLEMILRGKLLGFSIAEIQRLLEPLKNDMEADLETQLSPEKLLFKLQSLEQRRNEVDRAIHDLRGKLEFLDRQKATLNASDKGNHALMIE